MSEPHNTNQPEKIFAEGIYIENPHPNAPEFVKYKISMLASKVIPFIQQYANAKGYVNLVLKISRDGSPYLEVDLWQPSNSGKNAPVTQGGAPMGNRSTSATSAQRTPSASRLSPTPTRYPTPEQEGILMNGDPF